MKFQLHIITKMLRNKYFYCFQTLSFYIYRANKCLENATYCLQSNIDEHVKSFITSGSVSYSQPHHECIKTGLYVVLANSDGF